MRYARYLIFAAVVLTLCASLALAQNNTYRNYTCVSTSVTSATVPVAVMTPGLMQSWILHVRSTPASDPVLLFPYTGALPGTAPAGVIERASGTDFADQITCNAPDCRYAVGSGWGAVLASGVTATTVDACNR